MLRAAIRFLVLACVALAVRYATPAAAQTPSIIGTLRRAGGFGLIAWGGSTLSELVSAAGTQGCTLSAV